MAVFSYLSHKLWYLLPYKKKTKSKLDIYSGVITLRPEYYNAANLQVFLTAFIYL